MKKEFQQVSYYGVGPYESYIDKCKSSSHGFYSADIKEMHEDYIKPQENGSHIDCDYVILDSESYTFTAVSPQPFVMNASVYTQEELMRKLHNYELEESGSTVLCLDYKQNGIGSNALGPVMKEQYKFYDWDFCFAIKMIFHKKDKGD